MRSDSVHMDAGAWDQDGGLGSELGGTRVCFSFCQRWHHQHHNSARRRLTSVLCLTVEPNVGGIVAAVLVTLILLALLIIGIWYAYSRGYFERK